MEKHTFGGMNLFIRKIKPEFVFLYLALICGTCFIVCIPPFQSPDEFNHFYRAFQISEGHWMSVKDDSRLGGYLPESLVKINAPFRDLRFNRMAKTNAQTIVNNFKIPLEPDKKIFVDFPNTALYSPISYAPQVCTISLLRVFDVPPLYIFYFARFTGLIFWLLIIFFAIRITPVFKWFFVLISLLPMSLYINSSLSADIVTNSVTFLFIALVFQSMFSKNQFSKKQFAFFIFLAFIIASAKIVYAPVCILMLLIPAEKFSSKKWKFISLVSTGAVVVFTMLFWSAMINNLYIPFISYNPAHHNNIDLPVCSNMYIQKAGLIHEPLNFILIPLKTIRHTFPLYTESYIGRFGWLDTPLHHWIIIAGYLMIAAVLISDPKIGHVFSGKQKLFMIGIFFSAFFLLIISQYLFWECCGNNVVNIIQGRYLIPVAPLLFIGLSPRKKLIDFSHPVTITLFALVTLFISLFTIYARYFQFAFSKPVSFTCDAEKSMEGIYFRTSVPYILLGNGHTKNDALSKSGKYSCRVNKESPFGFTLQYYGGKKGDRISVDVWRYGNSGSIVFSGNSVERNFFYNSEIVVDTTTDNWQKLHAVFILPFDMEGGVVGVFVWNPEMEEVFFDDLKIQITGGN